MSLRYAELGAQSAFSFLEAASHPEDLALRAAELELDTIALTDRGGVYGAPRFHRAAEQRGLRAVVGARLNVIGLGWLRLLCETQAGYRALCRLLTLGHRDRPKGEHGVTAEQLAEHARGLTCLCGPGLDPPMAVAFDLLRGIYSRDHLAVEIWRHLDRAESEQSERLIQLADTAGLPVVATNDVRHARAEDKPLLDVLTCIHHHTTLDRAGRRLLPNREWRLKSPAEMAALFADRPDAIDQSRVIAERCVFGLEDLGYRFPAFVVPPGDTPTKFLRRLTYAGARERYRPLTPKVERQLERELGLIQKLELEGYFLIVWDISQFTRRHEIMAQGRGSAANSAVCYALGITAVDPVGMELLFERFLSEERGEWPDIDLDLPSGPKRESVIRYVFDKYGPHGAAMTANVVTYRDRSALREVGKVLGVAPAQIDQIAKLADRWSNVQDREQLSERLRLAGLDPTEHRSKLWMQLAADLLHLPRHLGQHSGGMVIAQGRLDEVVPIEPAAMAGRSVIQWDKDDCTALGIIKVDLLGLGMLAALEEAVPLIQQSEGKTIDYAHLPADDPAIYDMLCAADTVGMFQVESRAQMATLPRLRPRCFYDLVVEVALIRPGPIAGEMVHPYLRRRAGRESVTYPHPDLEPVLRRTLGVPIFQEQIMRISMIVAGFSGGEAEDLRRAMGFKRADHMHDIETRLRRGMTTRRVPPGAQDELVRYITSFSSYGFPESHSASFALIAYASAYLKRYHPAAFLAALLNAYPLGFYKPDTLVKDAQRHGVRVRPIDVTASSWRCTLEDKNTVRLGLRYVQGLCRAAGERILSERARQRFSSLADFERRCRLGDTDLATLAELGAFAPLGHTRRAALWQVARLRERTTGLLGRAEPRADANPLPEMDLVERIIADHKTSKMSVGSHPMRFYREALQARGILSAAELKRCQHDSRARVAGFAITRQRPRTAKGFFFVTLEDETGFSNLLFTPPVFDAFRPLVVGAGAMCVEGTVQSREGVVHLKGDRVEAMALSLNRPGGPKSGIDSR